jgi:hypothetical protein
VRRNYPPENPAILVLIEGPRACGRTATARQASRSEVLLDVDPGARRAAAVDPGLILAGPSPRLLDEWQVEPAIWNHVRPAVAERCRVVRLRAAITIIPRLTA